MIVISNLEFGGAQRQVVEFANSADPNRCQVHICSLSDYVPLAARLRNAEQRLHVIKKRWKFDIGVVPRLARLLKRLKADVVHGYLFDAEIAARLAGRMAGVPLVVGSERNTDYRLKKRQLATYRMTRSCVDLIIANSNAGAAFNSRTLGHDRSQYRVIHNGVNAERFRPQPAEPIRRKLAVDPDERVVGVFASFKEQKNHAMVFAAFQRVLRKLSRARLMLVGDQLYAGMHGSDEYKARMDRLVDELGIRERCLFLGNREDVERLYCACDLTLLASHFEGTPNVLLESMACGVPIVATDVSDNAMVAPTERVGFIVRPGDDEQAADAICRMLTDDALRHRMGEAARQWVEQEFSTARLAEKTAAAYEESLNGHRR